MRPAQRQHHAPALAHDRPPIPKGWTGPKVVDGLPIEGSTSFHQVPLSDPATHPEHLRLLEEWLRSYRPEELFDGQGRLKPELAAGPGANGAWAPIPTPTAAGCCATCACRTSATTRSRCPDRGLSRRPTRVHELGVFLRDVARLNQAQRNFRIFGPTRPSPTASARCFEVTNRQWDGRTSKPMTTTSPWRAG
jgi:xylulose-5-phosphate/fructose-6-phosphate phosphoketolase